MLEAKMDAPTMNQPRLRLADDYFLASRNLDEPAEIAAGEEVVVGRVPVHPNRPPGESEEQAEVQQNDQPVPAGHACSVAVFGGEGDATRPVAGVKKSLRHLRRALRRPPARRNIWATQGRAAAQRIRN